MAGKALEGGSDGFATDGNGAGAAAASTASHAVFTELTNAAFTGPLLFGPDGPPEQPVTVRTAAVTTATIVRTIAKLAKQVARLRTVRGRAVLQG